MSKKAPTTEQEPKPRRQVPWIIRAILMVFRIALRLLATAVAVITVTGCIIGCVMAVTVLNMLPKESEFDLNRLELNYTTIIYAENQETGQYEEMSRLDSTSGKRIWVSIDEMPQYLLDATVACEDKRFWDHQGVDFVRTTYAALKFFTGDMDGGGSTITQQLIKNISGDDEVRIDRKIKEIFRAIALEKEFSKEQILEAYLNVITFGYNSYGIQAAANLYFDKDVSELTLLESTGLIALTQNPSKWDLFSYEENNAIRREYVFDTMLEMGKITEAEHASLIRQTLDTSRGTITASGSDRYDSWFTDYVITEVVADLMAEYGWTEQHAETRLYQGGYRIYTTVDTGIQEHIQAKYEDPETFPLVYNEVQPDSAFVIMNYDGEIVALAGARGEKTGDRLFNIATDGVRHVGSAIKPISTYALALERNLITYSTVIKDEVVHFKGEEGFDADWPVNYYGGYLGPVTVDEAMQRSINTIPAKLVDLLTPRAVFEFLQDRLHITTLVESGYNNDVDRAPMALGALTRGISPLELCAAYQMIGNGGLYVEPHSYTEVLDSEGNVVLKAKTAPERVISSETAMVLNKLLQRVTTGPNGTGTTANLASLGIPVAGKTGSATDNTDLWFVGLTPYYLGAVWLGYSESMQEIFYGTYPTPTIWRNVMLDIHTGLPAVDFPASNNVVAETYCLGTGDIATEYCPSTAIGWYKKSNTPSVCTEHFSFYQEPEEGDVIILDSDDNGNTNGRFPREEGGRAPRVE